jgi:aspartate racemase
MFQNIKVSTQTVGILGGMGPAAGADFARLFVHACNERMTELGIPVRDQAYPEHWLAQVPFPDRSAALQDLRKGAHQPDEPLLQATGRIAALGARVIAIACNTAHAWHGLLQDRFPQLVVLHGMREVAMHLQQRKVQSVGLLATSGSYAAGLYQAEFERTGVVCHLPTQVERDLVMHGIYEGVKAGNYALARQCFEPVAMALQQRHGVATLVMGCTEIPLAMDGLAAHSGTDWIDPSIVLAKSLARHAYCSP